MANVCDGKDNVLSKAALKLDIGMEDDGYDSASSSETNLLSQQVRGYFQQPKIAIFSSSFFLHLFSSTKSRLEMGAGKGGECLKKFSFYSCFIIISSKNTSAFFFHVMIRI